MKNLQIPDKMRQNCGKIVANSVKKAIRAGFVIKYKLQYNALFFHRLPGEHPAGNTDF